LFMLSQASGFGQATRSYSQPSLISNTAGLGQSLSLPSRADLQRYINAYIQYFHPHMPFLHIPSLNFDSPAFTNNIHRRRGFGGGIVGGGGCLILAMAAIGASYEFEQNTSMELFDSAKKLFGYYLEERRKAQLSSQTAQITPLWLVQAMLLNLIFGHQCGEKVVVQIATTHCAALISLAKSAHLTAEPDSATIDEEVRSIQLPENGYETQHERESYLRWYRWKCVEERKRTLFSVFILSSLLVIGYNQAPKILNSELQLDLPCEEDFWSAESPAAWTAMGGPVAIQEQAIPFKSALEFLLHSSQRKSHQQRSLLHHQAFGSSVPLDSLPPSDLKPSTFGCYVLINALHVYIWETRQRHQGKEWKAHETEQLLTHIEPALREWQAAWRSNDHHKLDRPNPHGPLPADCIPLLDLAYVRLFVNLGRSKEAFWLRDFEGMADELGSGAEIIQHADIVQDLVDSQPRLTNDMTQMQLADEYLDEMDMTGLSAQAGPGSTHFLKRERLLRSAAFYATDSLMMADKLGATYAHFTSRELPMQAAMCTYDCTQVLAEWVATVQDRVGSHLGILGQAEIDFNQIPALALLEEEDRKLLAKVDKILISYERKLSIDPGSFGLGANLANNDGYNSRLLMATAQMLDKAAVWGSK
jgi:Fungal specific transcription factor domain